MDVLLEGRGPLLMKIRKSFAGVAAGSLALAGIAVVSAPAAQAATTNSNFGGTGANAPLSCWVGINGASGFIGQVSTSPLSFPNGVSGHNTVAHTITNAATVNQGSGLSVTYSATEGPRNGPAAVTGEVAIATYTVTGPGGSTDVVGSPSAPFNVSSNAWGPAYSMTDTIPTGALGAAGATTVRLKSVDFYAAGNFDVALGVVGSTGITTRCNANSAT